ncbi:hypothetical protein SERLA73DRAFT_190552 [Serpula lacrymans var. lacrymans S7.3]|uniref:4-hydroxybenzoate polyprenyltransferase, mitochondrial n=2 Tax=Serpula lacrymans var. lacrymans TaxID=341189 RepID=F8QFU2_SERL3|nr:uncharacterized protein SERLADRAFT_481081 [Serpula lacrymans var. lacrymans S7.9]EGN92832.1 hypothetical protein SERLA73DRAFT_190552 [Serpula lacrymans var. lacrymans S7.3]EGO18508.1 hypothetical protein SERLADRAFT_481081 [Serpula lacrymans var. lacrymans S7.9]
MRPYVQLSRLDMIAGSMLVFWPSAWGLTMAAHKEGLSLRTYAIYLAIFWIGSVIHHSAACIWNDIIDMDIDREVERTKKRPLASRALSVPAALAYLFPQVLICLGLLSLTNSSTFILGLVGLFFLDVVYPYMKRITYWPQAWLGIAINWGAVISWTVVVKNDDWIPAALLLVCSWCWTLHYDTCYGSQDKKDDARLGIKSTALLFASHAIVILSFFSTLFILFLSLAGWFNGQGWGFWTGVAGAAIHLVWQICKLDFDDRKICFEVFLSNGNGLGYVVWLGLFADYCLGRYGVPW